MNEADLKNSQWHGSAIGPCAWPDIEPGGSAQERAEYQEDSLDRFDSAVERLNPDAPASVLRMPSACSAEGLARILSWSAPIGPSRRC